MKVADIMEDLETGDRTMEHLNNPPQETSSFTFTGLRSALDQMQMVNLRNMQQSNIWRDNHQDHLDAYRYVTATSTNTASPLSKLFGF